MDLISFIPPTWFVLSIAIGAAAASRGRSWVAWFALSFLMSPVIAGLTLFRLPNFKAMELEERRHKETLAAIRADFVAKAKASKR